jgi:predicted TIM-barrel fold metal-dependent hydrolase
MARRFRHDPQGRRLPVKLDSTSNGEFAPIPLAAPARQARALAEARTGPLARRLGLSRREFLVSTMGAAATLAAYSDAFAAAGRRGGTFAVGPEAAAEPAAAQAAVGGDKFIFDVQLHHVNPRGAWRGRGWERALAGFPNARCGKDDPVDCFSADEMIKDVFLDSDTSMAVLSHVPGELADNPLDFEAAAATRAMVERLDGSHRLLLHGRVLPNVDGELERMDEQVARAPIAAFKTYTQFGPGGGYFLDDDDGSAMIERARKLGVRNIAVHKGIPFGQEGYEYSTCRDLGPAAKAHPDVNFLVYHSGFEPQRGERAFDAADDFGVNTLLRSLREHGVGQGGNVYAELGSTWRFAMRDPDVAAHLLGKLLLALGEDNILWGTDSIWYGSPQDQIQAFRAFRISDEFRDQYGYPQLTPEVKAKIFGLNAARVYGLDPKALRPKLDRDAVAKRRQAYVERRDPSFATYGPRTRREFLALKRLERG